jgi:hypothetical protein
MSKKSKDLETLGVLMDEVNEEKEQTDDEIQVVKTPVVKKKIYNMKPKDPNAPKKERTPAQIEAWNKALASRQFNRESRKTEKEMIQEELNQKKTIAKKAVEEKIVKKAISIKKKQIKKEVMLDEVSDDETPMEEIKKVIQVKRQNPPRTVNVVPETPKPKFYFM